MEYGEMGGAPAPFLVPYEASPSRAAQRWADLSDPGEVTPQPEKGPFGYRSGSGGSDGIYFTPGEGYVDGWFATDETAIKVDVAAHDGEDVTVVVGWDPDAVYSSDVHNSREEADSVIVDLERNVSDDKPTIPVWRGTVQPDGSGGYELTNTVDMRPIGRPIETLPYDEETVKEGRQTRGPGATVLRGRPTAVGGALAAGPIEAGPDEDKVTIVDLPVTDDLAAGDPVSYRFLMGTEAALDVEAESDGSGGVQNVSINFNGSTLVDPSGNEAADSMTADPESAAEDGYIEIEIGGTTYQIPIYQS